MTVDYRALNHQTKKDIYSLPRTDNLLNKLSWATCLSAIDLASGYHQVYLAPGDCKKTVFVTRYGLFEYIVLPLGLCNTPSTFQHLMNLVMYGFIDKFVLVYLDDVLVYSNNENEHELHLRQVFDRLREHKLQAKLKKCEFGKSHVKYLGHVVGSGELSVDCDKLAAVSNWEPPFNTQGI